MKYVLGGNSIQNLSCTRNMKVRLAPGTGILFKLYFHTIYVMDVSIQSGIVTARKTYETIIRIRYVLHMIFKA